MYLYFYVCLLAVFLLKAEDSTLISLLRLLGLKWQISINVALHCIAIQAHKNVEHSQHLDRSRIL